MKVLLLGPSQESIISILQENGDEVFLWDKPLNASMPILNDVDYIISYRYRYMIKKDVLSAFPNKVLNLHISLLPYNKGADPNLWSFLEDTPKGVTIHLVDEGLDTGPIMAQKEIFFNLSEDNYTLRKSYEILNYQILELFKKTWPEIRSGKVQPIYQKGEGSFHLAKDRSQYEVFLTKGWDTPVIDLIGLVKKGGIKPEKHIHTE